MKSPIEFSRRNFRVSIRAIDAEEAGPLGSANSWHHRSRSLMPSVVDEPLPRPEASHLLFSTLVSPNMKFLSSTIALLFIVLLISTTLDGAAVKGSVGGGRGGAKGMRSGKGGGRKGGGPILISAVQRTGGTTATQEASAGDAYYNNPNGARIIHASHFESEYILGRKLSFYCKAQGVPRPHITWMKDGIELYEHPFFQVHEYHVGKDQIISKMEIDPTTQRDSGYYECQADNKYAIDKRGFRTDYTLDVY